MTERRRIYLLRHGDAAYMRTQDGNPTDDPELSDRGVAEAEAAGDFLAEVPFDLVVATGLRRTMQTARLALGGRDLPIEVLQGLSEAKTGTFEGIETAEEMEAAVLGAFADAEAPDARFLTGERFSDVRDRAAAAWQSLIARSDWQYALVACHGVINRTILAYALGAGPEIYRHLEQDSGCVNVLDIEGAGDEARVAYVRLINFTPYNPTKRGMFSTTLEMLWRKFVGD